MAVGNSASKQLPTKSTKPCANFIKNNNEKAILFLLLLVSANSFAQIHRVAVYDFCTPSSLTPAITPGTEMVTLSKPPILFSKWAD